MRRGEVWTSAGGSDYLGKPRPVVVVQSDLFDATPSVTVCPLTSNPTEASFLRIVVMPSEANGLNEASRLMADKLSTLPRSKLGRRVGALDPAIMTELERLLATFLGIRAG